ncbi:TetR/AcrR family transcriptional regulator [Paractinoplanes lichenicola]|uniref:TetR family transcriptional regulator C-terminal domain-containing protein n=1 Tax=Paractinoplanes lichenicola TaxID=2802976 RepID=A0ABS1VNQ8_9ACTN|nr:TetR/AcrR family transcriptional regulator [Actinoplanes lichenicola]MBL7255764.1 TetR family transcriptional regulator C-terminal domain-containing protein [Actinoplanes lichenicola]
MPKRVDHEQRRRQIGEALLRIASTRGLQSATMREVAAEAGVSLRLVQYYFHTKEQLLVAALAYLGEQLTERVAASIRALGPVTPRTVVYGTLTAVLPTDEESVRLTRAYTGFYTLVFSDPELARRHGATYPDKLESLLARQIAAAQEAGQVAAEVDPALGAAALLALTNGLGSSVLGGQRDGAAARLILEDQLGRLFRPG